MFDPNYMEIVADAVRRSGTTCFNSLKRCWMAFVFLGFVSPGLLAATLPAGWTDADIGSPGRTGSASLAGGLWTVSGGGSDIWNAADQFNFASTPFNCDGAVMAQVMSLQDTDPWAKAGVMMRNDSSAGAINLSLVLSESNGVNFQWRTASNGQSSSVAAPATAPLWLALTRSANNFNAYYSADGSNWIQLGSTETMTLNGSLLAGLCVTAHNNSLLNTATFSNVTVSPSTFGFYRQLWTNLNSSAGDSLSMLTNTTFNPNWPNNPTASFTHIFTNFETEVDTGMNYYGQRVRGLIVPPQTGEYTFWIASDDTSQLFLSSDETAAHEASIINFTSWSPAEEWYNNASQQSAPVTLQAGHRYYLEAIMQQQEGGDNLGVGWELPNGTLEQPMAAVSSAGTLVVPYTGIDAIPGVFAQTTNATVVEGSATNLFVLTTNQSSMTYQWLVNGAPSGVTQPVFVMTNASVTNSGAVYACVLSNSLGAVTSAPIALTVTADTVPPVVTQIFNPGPSSVDVIFSKPVTPATATNLSNYSFSDGLAINGATLGADDMTLTLDTAPVTYGSNYSLVINGILDRAYAPVMIASNTVANFTALQFSPANIGGDTVPSSFTVVSNGLQVFAGGSGFAGTQDQGGYLSQPITGNFDARVCLAGLSLSSVWAQAGLMARASLDAGSPFAAALATPAAAGAFFECRSATNGAATNGAAFPVNYPNTWLRLRRTVNIITAYESLDGQNWTQLGSATLNLGSTVYLGLTVASAVTNEATSATFLDYTNSPETVVIGTTANPHEPLGACSRKTQIVFSEIMYKPAPRSDTNNCEFVELYNSQPWFHDLSGYQIVCADMHYTFAPNTIIPGNGFLVVAASPGSITSVYGVTNVTGPYAGSLKKSETLELLDEQSNVLLTVPYSATFPWPVAADGAGHSIVLANPSYGEGDPRAWDISDIVGGSPGAMESYRPSPLRNVMIDEVLAHSESAPASQYLKLYNHSALAVDISGCVLTDDAAVQQYVIPQGTVIPAGGFLSFPESLGFNLNPAGDTVYFINPQGSRILDALQFTGQDDGVSFGRWPDGANDLYPLQTPQPSTNNSAILIGDIVINELMYDPISGSDDDQYIELYNKGSTAVNLSQWQFTAGVTYTFPSNAVIPGNGYLVVGRDVANLLSKYSNLSAANTFGNYGGKLSHDGERVALAMPVSLYGTNSTYAVEDEVTYGTGGRWGQWSSGGGSSLELIDPHSNHRLAANWADSDETQKSQWVDIENTGVLDNGSNYEAGIHHAQLGLLDTGECLVDNVEADFNGVNYIMNSNFESGLANWALQGDHSRSSLDSPGYQSGYALHLRASDRFWNAVNSCQAALNGNTMGPGSVATLRFKARWLHGWPEVVMRLNGNWLEATGPLPLPTNLGSPGAANSVYAANAGPAIYDVSHSPSVPIAGQPVVVTARVHDPDGVRSLILNYRIDPSTNYTSVVMNDAGTGGDALAGDGVFSATIPAQSSNTVVAFYLSAVDQPGAATRFPALINDNGPVRECVVMFGDGNPGGVFTTYHVWMTQTNATRWANLSDLSNEGCDFTFVNNTRIIYNAQGHFAGSPYHQDFDTPYGNLCHYKWEFPDDDQFLGATDFDKIHQPGNSPGDDPTLQREQVANTFLRALGVPWLNRRYAAVFVNGNQRGYLMEDAQTPNSDDIKEHFPNDSDGFLFKMQPWFEFPPAPSGSTIGFTEEAWCQLLPYTTTGGVFKLARYRYNFEMRRTPDSANDYTNVYSLVTAADSTNSPTYVSNLEKIANMENWMRVFAANHAAGNWDSFGSVNGQNLYGYIGTLDTRYTLLMWDYNMVIGNVQAWGPGENLLSYNTADSSMAVIYNTPEFLRMYWRAMQELVNGPLNPAVSGPLCMAKYQAFVNSGYPVSSPASTILPWLQAAQSSIQAQLAQVNASAFSVNPQISVTNNIAYVSGVAPVNVAVVWVNGQAFPLTWTSLTNWTVQVPLASGTNSLAIAGLDIHGNPIAGASGTATAVYHGAASSAAGSVVINEIMYNPTYPNAQYVELYNNSTNYAFDLSGWQMEGLGYTFPQGATLAPNSFLVLAANETAFAGAYGAATPLFDTFAGELPTNGQFTLTLEDSSSNVVTEVQYTSAAPWPAGADGQGAALELIDPKQDNWRAGNWAGVSLSPSQTNTVLRSLPAFPPLWINEVQPVNLNGITDDAGQHAPWIELYNPTTNSVSLAGLYLADSYTNLTNWVFPSGSVINAGQFKVIFADGRTNLSSLSELHTDFSLTQGAGSVALSRVYDGQTEIVDYLDYTNLAPNYSYGSYPDGQSFNRTAFFYATPGATNNGALPDAVPYFTLNSVYTQNFDSLPDPGSSTVNAANPVTIDGTTYAPDNPLDFAAAVASGGLGLGATMNGWYGQGADAMKFGASAGDQSTGGIISFGTTDSDSTNRALGLLATSSTGATAFGLSLLNETTNTIDVMSLAFTGELWRQQPSAKTLSFSYYIDPTGSNASATGATTPLSSLDVNFPTGPFSAVDGTQPANQMQLSVTNQPILNWPPGAALWLVWQMTNDAGNSQGIAIDDLSFSADSVPVPPILTSEPQSQVDFGGNAATLSVSATGNSSLSYQWQFDGVNVPGATNSTLVLSNLTSANQGTYDVVVSDATGATVSQDAVITVFTHSYAAYTNAGSIYVQNFDSLPNPGATTVSTANPVQIGSITYSVADPVDFAFPIQSTGDGGLGLITNMPGWYGYAATAIKLGASAGDQTTGGIISFGATNSASTNRALGLLATSTTGPTAFALRLLNQTVTTLTNMSLNFTGELWRQQTAAKTLAFSYYIDPTGTNTYLPADVTASLPALNVSFPTGASAAGGTAPLMTSSLGLTNQVITNWPPGAALWLTWQMASAAGSSQGLAIDNLSFSAAGQAPALAIQQSNSIITLSWPATLTGYVLQSNLNLANPNGWQTLPLSSQTNTASFPATGSSVYFRLAP